MNSFSIWRTWTIYRADTNQPIVGSFNKRSLCREYLKFKKENCFFETGSMDEAEAQWGESNFIIDYSITIDRTSVFKNFNTNCEDWYHD